MRPSAKFALAGAAFLLAGTAYAASRSSHVMNVQLPDGAVAHIQYYGDVAPKVTIAPPAAAMAGPGRWAPMAMPQMGDMDRMFADMHRRMAAMADMAARPMAMPGVDDASYGNLPAGTNSVSVVTVNNGGHTCTRTTRVMSQGEGKPPKVINDVSGECGPETASAPPPPQPPAPPKAPPAPTGVGRIDHT